MTDSKEQPLEDPTLSWSSTESDKTVYVEKQCGSLYAALAKAIESVQEVTKDGHNKFSGYSYASAENVIRSSRLALAKQGLSLLPKDSGYVSLESIEWISESHKDKGKFVPLKRLYLKRTFRLEHKSGEHIDLNAPPWPVIAQKGRALDKAVASADTGQLRYMCRDILLLPQVDEGEDFNKHSDHEIQRKSHGYRPNQEEPPKRTLLKDDAYLIDKIKLDAEALPKHLKTQAYDLLQKAAKDSQKLRKLYEWVKDKVSEGELSERPTRPRGAISPPAQVAK